MKTKYLSVGILFMILFSTCHPQGASLAGSLQDMQADTIYLYQVTNEWYGSLQYQAAIPVVNGHFSYNTDSLKTGLYAFSKENQQKEFIQSFAKLFIEPTSMQVTISKNKYDDLVVTSTGSSYNDEYMVFTEELNKVANQALIDSMNHLFYSARESGDTLAMKKIKQESQPYYEESRKNSQAFIKQAVEQKKNTSFGLYLYYTYNFQNHSFNTTEEIDTVYQRLSQYPQEAKQLVFYSQITEALEKFKQCAVGSPAPMIKGLDKEDRPVTLSDFRGKYVLVDFWSSGCYWCRMETPNLLKTYNTFKDKNFTILGVSSDYKKSDWLKAIEKDKSFWNQIIIPKNDIRPLMDRYCITGIPHIILIDPMGTIIAKELRGEDIYLTVEKYIKQQ